MKVIPWGAICATVISLALIGVVAAGKLPWGVAAAFVGGSLLPVIQSKGGES